MDKSQWQARCDCGWQGSASDTEGEDLLCPRCHDPAADFWLTRAVQLPTTQKRLGEQQARTVRNSKAGDSHDQRNEVSR